MSDPVPTSFSYVNCPKGHQYDTRYYHSCAVCAAASDEAQRNPVRYRFDILDPTFLRALAEIASYGAEKYGDFNWQKSRLVGEKSPINHALNHINQFRRGEPHDKLNQSYKWHLASAAFNLMMEWWYEQGLQEPK